MITGIFKVSHNFAFLRSCFVIYTRWFNISKVSRIIVGWCLFVFIVILVLTLCVLCMVFPQLCYPLVVDIVPRLPILHYMNEVVAVESHPTSPSFLPSWLGRRWLIFINDWICLRGGTVVMLILMVVVEVSRANWLEQLARDWHVLSNQIRIGPIIKQKRRLLRLVLLLWADISLACT